MTEYTPAEVFPPGEILRDELDARGWTQEVLADILDRPPAVVNRIISGKTQITPETAQGLGEALGTGAEFWMNLESAYRLFLARQKAGEQKAIARRARLYEIAPVREIIKRRWIEGSDSIDVLETQICNFLEINSLDERPRLSVAARKSTSYAGHSSEQVAWMCRVRNLARSVQVSPFALAKLKRGLSTLRSLARNAEDVRHIPRCLSDLGIRFVVVEHLPRTKVDGACCWLDKQSPVIAVSIRFDRIDNFWFTLSHELGHVFHAHRLSVDSDLLGQSSTSSDRPKEEAVADAFAREFLIPQGEIESFIARVKPLYSKEKIDGFAALNKIHPGIVTGQLQHRDEISYSHSRDKLVKIRSLLISSSMTDGWGNLISPA